MKKLTAAGGIAVAGVALGLALAGCGSDTMTEATTTGAISEAATTSAQASGADYTIVDYIKDNGIVETPVKRGAPGSPTIDLPFPPGWEDAGARTPQWAYVMMRYTDPAMAGNPPTITAIVSKLTGNVDPAKILEFAPGELRNLPGFEGEGGNTSTLAGFDAHEIDGFYTRDGAKHMVAQKTVVIPGQDGLYVLQLNPDGLEDQMGPLMDAMAAIDEQTTITP